MSHSLNRIAPLIYATFLLFAFTSVSQASRVIIKAEASADYQDRQGSNGKGKPIRYHFVEGKFFKGHTNDNSLLNVNFYEIAENLASHLSQHHYVPTGDTKGNDVMLLVNWGVTAVEDSFEDFHGIDSDDEYDQLFGSPVASENAEGETEVTFDASSSPNWGAVGVQSNSRMLGFWETMHDGSLMPSEHHEFQMLLKEERYFIVVIAFDNKKFLKGEKEILWTTRFSMRASGKPFRQAYAELTATASDYFGKNIRGLTNKRSDDQSKVKMGDIQVLDTMEQKEGGK